MFHINDVNEVCAYFSLSRDDIVAGEIDEAMSEIDVLVAAKVANDNSKGRRVLTAAASNDYYGLMNPMADNEDSADLLAAVYVSGPVEDPKEEPSPTDDKTEKAEEDLYVNARGSVQVLVVLVSVFLFFF